MRANRVKEIWQQGGTVINGWCSIPSGLSAEIMAHMGWDSLVIDTQHGIIGYEAMVAMLQGISTTETMPMVRVSWNDPAAIMKALDAGAYGIICPMISSRAEAEQFVGACRYPMEGYRSSGPTRAVLYAGNDYAEHANDTIVTLAMVETQGALDNLDAIMTTPGLDGVYVGPSDLSLSQGLKMGLDREEAAMLAHFARIVERAHHHGIKAGIHTGGTAYAKRMIALGFDYVTVLGDIRLMTMSGEQALAEMRQASPKPAGNRSGSPY
jgi:4-hydroxy-2-oxoheptanedioate aldolase